MKVKRFTAASMQAALRTVSQQLGADAVILSSKKTAQGIEVIAALDYRPELGSKEVERQLMLQQELETARAVSRNVQDEMRRARRETAANADLSTHEGLMNALSELKKTNPVMGNGQTVDPALLAASRTNERPAHRKKNVTPPPPVEMSDDLEDHRSEDWYDKALQQVSGELRDLKDWMVGLQGSPWDSQRPLTWQQAQLWQRCQDVGLEPNWADQLVARVGEVQDVDRAWNETLAMMAKDVPVAPGRLFEKGGMYAFVGPTGAGKTTTIGKVAAQFVIRHGADSVALVTLDNYRVAAHDQLRTFARILGVQLHVVPPSGDLGKVLTTLRSKRLVLVDSAGMSSQDPHFDVQLAKLKGTGPRLKKLLALPLTSQGRCLQENYELFKPAGLSGCVLTKLDECFSLGAAMSVAALTQLPVTLVTDGPHIPDDVHYPDANKLVNVAEQMARLARTRWQAAELMSSVNRRHSFQQGA